jgi:hypothetical protein
LIAYLISFGTLSNLSGFPEQLNQFLSLFFQETKMRQTKTTHGFFSIYFKGLPVTCFAVNPLTQKMLASSGVSVFLFDLLTAGLLRSRNYQTVALELFPFPVHTKIEVTCIQVNVFLSHWIVLVNNRYIIIFNDFLDYAPAITLDFTVSEFIMNPSSDLLACLREDRRLLKLYKIEATKSEKDQALAKKQDEERPEGISGFEAFLVPQKSPMSIKGSIGLTSLSELDLLALIIDSKEIVLLSCSRCEIFWTIPLKGDQISITALNLYKEFLFFADEKWLYVFDLATHTEIKKKPNGCPFGTLGAH